MQRDPMGYVDGMGLYEFVGGRVTVGVDPMGSVSATVVDQEVDEHGYRYGVVFTFEPENARRVFGQIYNMTVDEIGKDCKTGVVTTLRRKQTRHEFSVVAPNATRKTDVQGATHSAKGSCCAKVKIVKEGWILFPAVHDIKDPKKVEIIRDYMVTTTYKVDTRSDRPTVDNTRTVDIDVTRGSFKKGTTVVCQWTSTYRYETDEEGKMTVLSMEIGETGTDCGISYTFPEKED